jgi:fermentation-respiration switch protein FrsA (DUF1100 family)
MLERRESFFMEKFAQKFTKIFAILLLLASQTFFVGCSSVLYHPSHQKFIDPEKNGISHEEVSFMSTDGTKLHGWYFKSPVVGKPGAPKAPRAQFVFFHGNGENMTTHFASLAWILPFGYDYFIFDYRGYGISEGDPTPEGTVRDGMAAIRYAHQRNPNVPLIVFAQSLGGPIAMRSLIELKREVPIKWVVLDSTFLSYDSEGRSVLSKSWITWLFQPLPYLLLSDAWAPGDRVSEISPTPILVMHGDKDRTVDYSLGVDLFTHAREPKEFWKIEGGQHIDAFWEHKGIYRTKFLDRLDNLLGGKKTPPNAKE